MNRSDKLKHELKAVGLAMLYFGCWIAALLGMKELILAEYQIAFSDWSLALVGALILAKVVLILEHVPLGAWLRKRPAWVDVIMRTALYSFGVALVMVLEKGFEGRHEYGGFGAALRAAFQLRDAHHILVNTIGLSGALLGYNLLTVVRRHLGPGGLAHLLLVPLAERPPGDLHTTSNSKSFGPEKAERDARKQ